MKFAVSSWNYTAKLESGMGFDDMVRSIQKTGYGIELWLPSVKEKQAREFEEHYKGNFSCISCHTSLIHEFSEEILLDEMKLSSRLGATILVLHPRSLGFNAGTWDYRHNETPGQKILSRLNFYCETAASQGLMLALENGPMDLLETAMNYILQQKLQSHFGICIDTGHAAMHRKEDPAYLEKQLNIFHPHLLQMHVHDNQGEADEHSIPGRGWIDWSMVISELKDKTQTVPIVFELKNPLDPLEALAESVAHLERIS